MVTFIFCGCASIAAPVSTVGWSTYGLNSTEGF